MVPRQVGHSVLYMYKDIIAWTPNVYMVNYDRPVDPTGTTNNAMCENKKVPMVKDGFTFDFRPYNIGHPLPTNAAIIGPSPRGEPLYLVGVTNDKYYTYYIPGEEAAWCRWVWWNGDVPSPYTEMEILVINRN